MSAFPNAVVDLVWERADSMCERCGRGLIRGSDSVPYSLQHRRARGSGGSRNPVICSVSNAALVCGSATTPDMCHEELESNRERAKNEAGGWVLPHGANPQTVPILHWSGNHRWLLPDGTYGEEVWAA